MVFKFRAVNRDIFEAIREGKKKIETRARTEKFVTIRSGDMVTCICGEDSFEKRIKAVKSFKTIAEMLKEYAVREINPRVQSTRELEEMYDSFPGYSEKIQQYGLIAFELE